MLGLLQSPFDRTLDRRRVELLVQFFLRSFSLPEATTEDMESCCRSMMMEVADLSFFYYQVMVQDERAHKYVNANKGSGGAKPCILCRNCVQRNS